ncbi:MAG: hypothetical protein HAW67_04210 [Endozoicomonadaceae bacterium]|nr:hypothetical protein [Endozoicomonadaceae bacterium]
MHKKLNLTVWISAILYVLMMSYYAGISLLTKPQTELYLMDANSALYQPQDLTRSHVSMGRVKQFFADSLTQALTLNFVNYLSDDDYAEIIKIHNVSLNPDIRDQLKETFTEQGQAEFFKQLKKESWYSAFWDNRMRLTPYFVIPPYQKSNSRIVDTVNGKRFAVRLTGSFYLTVKTRVLRFGKRYRYDFDAVLIRDNKSVPLNQPYFFPPLIKKNRIGYKIDRIIFNGGDQT